MENPNIVVDTDIIIDYLKKRQAGTDLLKRAYLKHKINITSIPVYESFTGFREAGRHLL